MEHAGIRINDTGLAWRGLYLFAYYVIASAIPLAILLSIAFAPEFWDWMYGRPFVYAEASLEAARQLGYEIVTTNLIERVPAAFLEPVLWMPLIYAGAPTIAAVIVVAAFGKRGALRSYAGRFNPFRNCDSLGRYLRLYLVLIVASLLLRVPLAWVAGDWTIVLPFVSGTLVYAFLAHAFIDQGGLLEEGGWRAFALPYLQGVLKSPLNASIAIGLIWSAWHLPRDLLQWDGNLVALLVEYAVFTSGTISISIFIAYFFNRLGGSVIPAIMIHGLVNQAFNFAESLAQQGEFPVIAGQDLPTILVYAGCLAAAIGVLGVAGRNLGLQPLEASPSCNQPLSPKSSGIVTGLALAVLVVSASLTSHRLYAADATTGVSAATVDRQELEEIVTAVVSKAMDDHRIPGIAVAITMEDEIVLLKGYGKTDAVSGVPVDPSEHLFRVASVTKPFTWLSVLQLVERGGLDLNVDINRYLDFEIPDQYPGRPVTLWHLITHTAGFEATNIGTAARSAETQRPLGQVLKSTLPLRVSPPGEQTSYSNYGAALAGYIVERTAAMPLAEFLEANTFKPLGMTRSTLRQPVQPEFAPLFVTGHTTEEGKPVAGTFDFMNTYPDGAMSMSVRDLALFAIAQLRSDGYKSLSIGAENHAATRTRQFGNLPQVAGMTLGFEQKMFNGRVMYGHGGDISYHKAKLIMLADERVSLSILANSDDIGLLMDDVIQAFMDRYFPGDDDEYLFSADPVEHPRSAVAGSFVPSRRNHSTIEKLVWPLMLGLRLEPVGDRTLRVNFAGESSLYQFAKPGVYLPLPEDEGGNSQYGALVLSEDPASQSLRIHFSQIGSFGFVAAPLSERLDLHGWLLVLAGLIGLGGVLLTLLRLRKQRGHLAFAAGLAAIAGVVALFIFVVAAAGRMNADLIYGVSGGFRMLFWIPVVALLAALASLVLLVRSSSRQAVSFPLVLGVSLAVLSVLVISWQLSVWNMFGPFGLVAS